MMRLTTETAHSDPDALIEYGHRLVAQGRLDQALACYEEALSSDPDGGYAWFSKGCVLAAMGRHHDAVEAYLKLTELDPTASVGWYNLGNSLRELGHNDQAIHCFDQAARLDPADPDPLINQAALLDVADRRAEAIVLYDLALGLAPDDAVAWANRGNTLKASRRYEEALISYGHAMRLDENSAAGLFGSTECLLALGRLDEGLVNAEAALTRHPDDAAGLCCKAALLSRKDLRDAALDCLRRAVEIAPRSPHAWTQLGDTLGSIGRWNESVPCFDGALEVYADHPPALLGKARALFYLDNRSGSEAVSRALLRGKPKPEIAEAARQLLALCGLPDYKAST